MIPISPPRGLLLIALVAASLFQILSPLRAAPLGISLLKTVDLSPGADAYFPFRLAVNHTTHKMYVPGAITPDGDYPPTDGGVGYGVKAINTATNTAIAGVPMGFYNDGSGNKVPFRPIAIAVDESVGPIGNKIYVVGQVGDDRLFLRKIDGSTDTKKGRPCSRAGWRRGHADRHHLRLRGLSRQYYSAR